jgi:hypothetical protein
MRGRILAAMTNPARPRRTLPTSPFTRAVTTPPEQFAVGDRVTHDKYGLGRIIAVEGESSVIVSFGETRRRIATPYTAMTKL